MRSTPAQLSASHQSHGKFLLALSYLIACSYNNNNNNMHNFVRVLLVLYSCWRATYSNEGEYILLATILHIINTVALAELSLR